MSCGKRFVGGMKKQFADREEPSARTYSPKLRLCEDRAISTLEIQPNIGFVNLNNPTARFAESLNAEQPRNASFLAQLTIVRIANVTKPLKEHAPAPRHGQNYHQWLSAQ